MFRFWFFVNFKNKDGEDESADLHVVIKSDSIFDAQAQLVYQISRNPAVFAPFSYYFQYMEEWVDGKWKVVLQRSGRVEMLWTVTLDYGKSADTAKRGTLKVYADDEEGAKRAATLMVASFEYVNIVKVERDRSRA